MTIWLDPSGKSTFGIGLCARCGLKFSQEDLLPDPNSPGLMVCLNDLDDLDPYRLPARQTENITLGFYRPDLPLTGTQEPFFDSLALARQTEENEYREVQEDERLRQVEGID